MPGYHSPRSPSSAHRWRACPASVKESKGLPDSVGEDAIQGTVFHEYAADCVEFGIEGWGMVGSRMLCEDGKHREFTKEMAVKMLPGLDLINSIVAAPGAKLFVEKWVDLAPWLGPDEGGTSDVFVIDVLQRRLTVFDWKWGAGVPVEPKWNDQGILYTLGVWNTYAKELFEQAGIGSNEIEVQIIIEQPRAPGGGGVWTVQLQTLLKEGVEIKRDADATREENPEYNPGEKQCQFCAAARLNTCRARVKHLTSMLDLELEDAEAAIEAEDVAIMPDLQAMTPEERSYVLLNKAHIEKWLSSLHEQAMEDAKRGRPVPGMKRIAGRNPPRAWRDEDKATFIVVERFGEEAYRKKLLSPTMVEDEVGKKTYRDQFARHVQQGDPKPVLVPETHPGEPLVTQMELIDELWEDETVETDSAEALI